VHRRGVLRRHSPAGAGPPSCCGILVALLAVLVFLLGRGTGGATGFYLQLAFMAVLAPIVPLIYAVTFPADRDVR